MIDKLLQTNVDYVCFFLRVVAGVTLRSLFQCHSSDPSDQISNFVKTVNW
jgi:hypothetical protein